MLRGFLEAQLGPLALAAARALPLAWLLPALGEPTLPVTVRLAMGLGLAALCLPMVAAQSLPEAGWAWAVLAAREVSVGLGLGFVVACWFRAAQSAGCYVDRAARGDRCAGAGDGVFSRLMSVLAVVVFLEIGGLHHVVRALARSYDAIPLSRPVLGTPYLAAWAAAVALASAKLFEAALGLCAPVVVALVLTDLVLGAIGRVVPQLARHDVAAPSKAMLSLGALLCALGGIEAGMQGSLAQFLSVMFSAMLSAARIRP